MALYNLHLNELKPADEWSRPGKPEWPDLLALRMDRLAALRLISSLTQQLERALADGSIEIHIPAMPGKLTLLSKD